MLTQPTPTVTAEDIARIARREFPPENVSEVLAIIDEYGIEKWHREPTRVRLAILKLAEGSIERLRNHVETAKWDFRDVLSWAEYPEYSKAMFHIRQQSETERQRIIDADWSQYQDWLGR
ncbi:MAG TPA: hypothetical protein VH280_06225 [Verrucomicrobiae bacterium]|jgi:hypothetical protein|nr:hypothetical protein [Verrucomicrobiae bacterium]